MKQIIKQPCPEQFEEWKIRFKRRNRHKPTYDDLSDAPEVKQKLKKSLLEEQGHICCYCMKRITAEESHIEHFVPRTLSWKYPAKDIQLGYENLFASCMGENADGSHCGHHKDKYYSDSLLCPTETDMEKHFTYSANGAITGTDEQGKETVDVLNLDCYVLRAHRTAAIWSCGLYDDSCDDREELVRIFREKDEEGNYAPFCAAILDVLERDLSNAET